MMMSMMMRRRVPIPMPPRMVASGLVVYGKLTSSKTRADCGWALAAKCSTADSSCSTPSDILIRRLRPLAASSSIRSIRTLEKELHSEMFRARRNVRVEPGARHDHIQADRFSHVTEDVGAVDLPLVDVWENGVGIMKLHPQPGARPAPARPDGPVRPFFLYPLRKLDRRVGIVNIHEQAPAGTKYVPHVREQIEVLPVGAVSEALPKAKESVGRLLETSQFEHVQDAEVHSRVLPPCHVDGLLRTIDTDDAIPEIVQRTGMSPDSARDVDEGSEFGEREVTLDELELSLNGSRILRRQERFEPYLRKFVCHGSTASFDFIRSSVSDSRLTVGQMLPMWPTTEGTTRTPPPSSSASAAALPRTP
jgi:hypothetical protein